jgi:ATP-dependent RNA helicase RhlE
VAVTYLQFMQFSDLKLNSAILDALNEQGYSQPTPIQEQAIPHVLNKADLLAVAQTGTGKTAAFSIPIIQNLAFELDKSGVKKPSIKALILTPTRELAIQIDENVKAYSRHTKLKHTVIFGGVKPQAQINKLRAGVDILIATPGRLLDLVGQGFVNIKQIKFFVLDEADRMLDMGFIHDINRILKLIPEKRQTLFFSATMPPEIVQLSKSMLNNPIKISVTPPSSTVEIINQQVYYVDKKDKNALLAEVLADEKLNSVLIFTRTKYGADKLTKFLSKRNISAEAIHGNKSQNARQRALENFKENKTRVLVATDIAARGIDVDNLAYVINYEVPNIAETYVHRIGRTGRAGASGTAISFCDAEEVPYIVSIEKLTHKKITVVESPNFNFSGKVNTVEPSSAKQKAKAAKQNNQRRKNRRRPRPQSAR